MNELSSEERLIIYLLYGFNGNDIHFQRKVGKKLELSQSGISRRLTKILHYLKEELKKYDISKHHKVKIK